MARKKFPFYRQLDNKDCGPTCLRMVAKFYGKTFSREFLRDKAGITRTGVNMGGIADAAEAIELRTLGMRLSLESLVKEAPTPFIVPWRQKYSGYPVEFNLGANHDPKYGKSEGKD